MGEGSLRHLEAFCSKLQQTHCNLPEVPEVPAKSRGVWTRGFKMC